MLRLDTARPTALDVWVDIACPWCFIGRRHLAAALSSRPVGSVAPRHRAFELQPNLPERGVPAREFFVEKFGEAGMVQAFERVSRVGATVGIDFDFAGMPVAPNTRLAHRAVLLFAGDERQPRVIDALFSAYFELALDITDVAVVARVVAQAAGEAADGIRARLEAGDATDAVERDLDEARQIGVTAVPTFVADGRYAVQGAQPASVLEQFLETRLGS